MKNKFVNKKDGFSLAEALITLLIVCLIVLASVPVLTKKRRTMTSQSHGSFACYWVHEGDNSRLVGKYYINGVTSDGSITADTGENRNGCVFNPPANAKNFVVTVVGGGGGGAAGFYKDFREVFYQGSRSFTVPANGYYNAIVIGGGGGGGGSKGGCSDPDCGGGGSSAGIAGFKNQMFNKNDTLSFEIGGGGNRGDGDREMGKTGGASKIFLNGQQAVYAGGGGAGYGRGARIGGGNPNWNGLIWKQNCSTNSPSLEYLNDCFVWSGEYPEDNPAGLPATTNTNWIYSDAGGSVILNSNYITTTEKISQPGTRRARAVYKTNCPHGSNNAYCVNKKYSTYNADFGYGGNYGAGGRGDRDGSSKSKDGEPGVGVLKWKQAYGGLGGSAGKVLQIPFAQLPQKTLCFPGKGGLGGTRNGIGTGDFNTLTSSQQNVLQADDGQSSYIKNYPEAIGGRGAIVLNYNDDTTYSDSNSSNGFVKGGDGELANINTAKKPVGGAGGYSTMADNGYVNNNSANGHTRPIFVNGAEIDLFNRLIGAGAGGGGGSSDGNIIGAGGRGSSGIVFIQW